jgi:phenylalanyl-tRNA synthetase beta chain
MKAPISWLKEYVDIDCPGKELAEKMTMTGTKEEETIGLGGGIQNVVVGRILKITEHPNADKLVLCQIDIGADAPIHAVTGAPNVAEGQLVPVALDGACLPGKGGMEIKKGKIRGEVSEGMLCSGEELELADTDYPGAEVYGILILHEDYPPGMDIRDALMLSDTVIDYEITSNRPDCLCIRGLAREAAVTLGKPYMEPEITLSPMEGAAEQEATIRIEDSDLCPRYCGLIVKDIKIEPSPMWLKRRLAACGVRSINNIVDITNYVMLEVGQPLHAFDLDKLTDKTIVVRRAKPGETLMTLDDQERPLEENMLVIADSARAVALAGVMGGANSEISDKTRNILVESAVFDPVSVRKTAKALGMRTEASMRMERGLTPRTSPVALKRMAQMVQQLNAGRVVDGLLDVCKADLTPKSVSADWPRINELLGLTLTPEEMRDILTPLGFDVTVNGEQLAVTVPHYRLDIEGTADIAEEVARLYGYNNIPMTLMPHSPSQVVKTERQYLMERIRECMVGMGAYEASTYAFQSEDVYEKMRLPVPNLLRIANPLGEDQGAMRTTLLPGLLASLAHNQSHKVPACMLFETGRVFITEQTPERLTELPDEPQRLGLVWYGDSADFLRLKGMAEVLFDEMGLSDAVKIEQGAHPSYHPGRCASIVLEGNTVGTMGEVHPDCVRRNDLSGRVYAWEMELDSLLESARIERTYCPLPRCPAVERDLAVVLAKDIPAARVHEIICREGGEWLESASLFDVYEGAQVPAGCRSLAYSLSYRAADRTLTDEEINPLQEAVVAGLARELDAKLRA